MEAGVSRHQSFWRELMADGPVVAGMGIVFLAFHVTLWGGLAFWLLRGPGLLRIEGPKGVGRYAVVAIARDIDGWDPDWFASIEIREGDGTLVAIWESRTGLGGEDGFRHLVDSMVWDGTSRLVFDTPSGRKALEVK
jgi:hypothetical protein